MSLSKRQLIAKLANALAARDADRAYCFKESARCEAELTRAASYRRLLDGAVETLSLATWPGLDARIMDLVLSGLRADLEKIDRDYEEKRVAREQGKGT